VSTSVWDGLQRGQERGAWECEMVVAGGLRILIFSLTQHWAMMAVGWFVVSMSSIKQAGLLWLGNKDVNYNLVACDFAD